jgi:hypothetical protein
MLPIATDAEDLVTLDGDDNSTHRRTEAAVRMNFSDLVVAGA